MNTLALSRKPSAFAGQVRSDAGIDAMLQLLVRMPACYNFEEEPRSFKPKRRSW